MRGKTVLWLAAGAASLAAGAAVGVALFTHGALRPPRKLRRFRKLRGLRAEEINFEALDGTRLNGWFLPAPEPRAAVVLCHGYLGNCENMLPHAKYLRAAGYSCLLFDFRAQGKSKGSICTFGYLEAIDVRGAVLYLQGRSDTCDLPIAGLGLSMGAVALITAAPACPELRVIVAEGIYPTLAQAISRRCDVLFGRMAPLAHPIVRRIITRQLGASPDDVSPLNTASQLEGTPTLFIHAEEDRFIDADHADAIVAQSAGPKAFWAAAGARHCHAFEASPDEYAAQVIGFLAAHGV